MLNSCLDIFEARIPSKTIGHDFGLLHALDERIAMYGWVTNTGVKLVIVVDMEGRPANSAGAGKAAVLGLKDRDLTPVRDALEAVYFLVHWLTSISIFRLSKLCKQHTFACLGIRSTCPMSTTHAEPKRMHRSRSTAQILSRKSKGLAMPGILAIRQSEDKISPIYEDVRRLVIYLDADVQAPTRF
jgi:hypothetical protein